MSDAPNAWTRFDIVAKAFAAVGLPVILGLVGYWHTQNEKEANRRELAQRDSIAAEERRADRLTSFIQHLSSDNALQRRIAIRVAGELGLRNQLPKELVSTLASIAESGTDSAERSVARSAAAFAVGGKARSDALIAGLFAPDASERIRASEALVRTWKSDPQMVPTLLRYATEHVRDANGVFNTFGVLTQICPNGTAGRDVASAIRVLADTARRAGVAGDRINALIAQVERCNAGALRVWLLAGGPTRAAPFDSLRAALQQTGVTVAGQNASLQDETRPPGPEVRYYN
jgi:hypothetical protein